jgi:hypothetical protein
MKAPRRTLAEHLADRHPRVKVGRKALAVLQRAHGRDHHHYKGNHFHAYPTPPVNPGPDNRPPGWKTGADVEERS